MEESLLMFGKKILKVEFCEQKLFFLLFLITKFPTTGEQFFSVAYDSFYSKQLVWISMEKRTE